MSPGSVMLARVLQVSPVRVRFAISDREYLNNIKKNTQDGLVGLKARLQLPNGDAYQSEGSLDFVDNRMENESLGPTSIARACRPGFRLLLIATAPPLRW